VPTSGGCRPGSDRDRRAPGDPYPLPVAHIARPGDRWRGPYRPSPSDVQLSGTVDDRTRLTCEAGGAIEALQLTTDQHLGDYSGYSGGPVERSAERAADHDGSVVLGILLEQAPSRDATAAGRSAANVLFSATIAEAMRAFDYFDVGHLVDVLRPPTRIGARDERVARPVRQTARADKAERVAETEIVLTAIRQWAEGGLIDPSQAAEFRHHTVRKLIDTEFGSEGGS
jgi:hypothetical protein